MTILSKYVIKNHTSFMLLTLGLGIAIFIIIDLIERADIFLTYEGGGAYILPYYLLKLPGIISQILPAVFLLATVILLCIMNSSRETVALFAGGISLAVLIRILMILGLFWGCVQFFCSQVLVVYCEESATKMWREDVRKWDNDEKKIESQWFIEDQFIVHVNTMFESGKGTGFTAYQLSRNENEIRATIKAQSFVAKENQWILNNVTIMKPNSFEIEFLDVADLPLAQNPSFFFVAQQREPQKLDFFILGQAIERLEVSGSNVEDLKTIWYGKLAYSLSICVFAFVATAIVTYKENVYIAVILSVVMAFCAYVLTMFGDSLGKVGSIPPLVAAFGPQFLVFSGAFARIFYVLSNKKP